MISLYETVSPLLPMDGASAASKEDPEALSDGCLSASTATTRRTKSTFLLLAALHMMIEWVIDETPPSQPATTETTTGTSWEKQPIEGEHSITWQNSNVVDRPLTNILAPCEGGLLLTRAIFKVMGENLSDVLVQEQACRSLSLLSVANGCWILDGDCLPILLKAMRENLANPSIQIDGCHIISNVFAADASPAVEAASDVFSVVLLALQTHPDHSAFQEQGRATLAVLFLSIDVGSSLTALWDRLSDPAAQKKKEFDSIITGVEGHVVATMQQFPMFANLQAHGCKALRALLAFRVYPTDSKSSAIEAIICAMNRHSTDKDVLLNGCAALAHLSFSKENCSVIVHCGGVEPLLLALRQNQLAHAIQTQGRTAIFNVFGFGSIPAILVTMKDHSGDRTIQKHGCRALAKLSKDNENTTLMLEHGGIGILVAALREFSHVPAILESGRTALMNLLRLAGLEALLQAMRENVDEPTMQELGCRYLEEVSLVAENGRLLVQQGGVGAILAALQAFPQLPALQAEGRAALLNLFQFGDIDTVLGALRQNLQEPCLSLGCASLYHLSNNDDNVGVLLEKGGFNLLTESLLPLAIAVPALQEQTRAILFNLSSALRTRLLPVEVQRQCCHCIDVWATNEDSWNSGVLEDVVSIVAAALKVYADDPELVKSGCVGLANLSSSANNRALIVRTGAVSVLARAMKLHLHVAEIQEAGCRFLANLTTGDYQTGDFRGRPTQQEVIDALVSALRVHGELAYLQELAIHSIASLAINEINRTMIVQEQDNGTVGAIHCVLAAMQRHLFVPAVQKQACYAIKNLSISHEYIRVLIAREGGIEAVLAALRAHPCDTDVQSLGCGALRNLARNRDNKVQIGQKGGIGSILLGMRESLDNSVVLTNCYKALAKLSSLEENCVLIARENGIPTILCGMRDHKLDPGVQEHAVVVLRNLSCDLDGGVVIVREGGLGLVIESMKTHSSVTEIQRNGFLIFSNLAACAKLVLTHGGGVDTVKAAMVVHKNVPKVQINGLACLNRMMGRDEDNETCDTHDWRSSRRSGRDGSSSIGTTYSGSKYGKHDRPYAPFLNAISMSMSF